MASSSIGDTAGKLLLRLCVGVLMLFHGVAKIIHPAYLENITRQVVEAGMPSWVAYGVFVGEVLAPLLIVLGLFARFGGILVAGNMVVAIYLAHMAQLLTLSKSGGWALELQTFYLLGGLAIAFLGSGRAALRPD